jgi:glycosyltransferase involved in cell wall biosynthesis
VNILQLCKYYPPILGGIELVEKTITKAHTDLGDNVTIVAFADEKKDLEGEFAESVYLVKQDVFFQSAPINFRFLFNFKDLLKKHSIERIYVHLPNPFMHEILRLNGSYLKKCGIEVVAVYHSDIVNQKVLGRIYDFYFSLSAGVYDKWICSSQKLWDTSTILNKQEKVKQRVIPFCTEEKFEYRERKSFKGKLLAVGRLVPYKGFEFLINAINQTNYELNIIGDGPEFEKLKQIAGKNIILHRRISDEAKKELFDKSDLLVVSSINRAEAYGMIIVEAFEAGLPVVSSNINSGVTFLVQNEKTGLTFEIKNEKELIKSIDRLAGDESLYNQISINTRRFFDSELSYKNFKDKIERL